MRTPPPGRTPDPTHRRGGRPRVTAHHHRDALTNDVMCGISQTTPRVVLTVEFDLHDHTGALIALEAAVQDVRTQIEETRPDPLPTGPSRCSPIPQYRPEPPARPDPLPDPTVTKETHAR